MNEPALDFCSSQFSTDDSIFHAQAF